MHADFLLGTPLRRELSEHTPRRKNNKPQRALHQGHPLSQQAPRWDQPRTWQCPGQ